MHDNFVCSGWASPSGFTKLHCATSPSIDVAKKSVYPPGLRSGLKLNRTACSVPASSPRLRLILCVRVNRNSRFFESRSTTISQNSALPSAAMDAKKLLRSWARATRARLWVRHRTIRTHPSNVRHRKHVRVGNFGQVRGLARGHRDWAVPVRARGFLPSPAPRAARRHPSNIPARWPNRPPPAPSSPG